MNSHLYSAPRQGLNRRQAETVERLMEAGSAELASVGHEALTIRNVATRAGVSPATAYTYLASKNHLFAELFWRHIKDDPWHPTGAKPVRRLKQVTRHLAERLATSPEVASAANLALLSTDPNVERLRLRIGAAFLDRFREALGDDADEDVLETLTYAFSGALLQAGMGMMSYAEMADRLDTVVDVVTR